MKNTTTLTFILSCLTVTAAYASVPVPGPAAGAALGPAGLLIAAAGYAGYRFYKSRNRK